MRVLVTSLTVSLALALVAPAVAQSTKPAPPPPGHPVPATGSVRLEQEARMGALAERARQRLVQRPELRALREAQASQEIRSTDAKLQAQYQSPAPDVEVLKSETEHWNRLRDDRRRGYRHYARQRWNDSFGKKWESASQRSDVKAELSEHGRRLARLDRLKFLVATERKGEERTKLTAKLAQLRELEEARHERAMQGLTAVPEGATVAAAPAASGAKP